MKLFFNFLENNVHFIIPREFRTRFYANYLSDLKVEFDLNVECDYVLRHNNMVYHVDNLNNRRIVSFDRSIDTYRKKNVTDHYLKGVFKIQTTNLYLNYCNFVTLHQYLP